MKLIVFSDIHGNQYAFDAFLKEIARIDYDKIIFCGDIFGYYYGQQEIIDGLEKMENLIWIQGNHDSYAVAAYYGRKNVQELVEKYGHSYERMFSYLDQGYLKKIERLPFMYELEADKKKIGIFHGTPDNITEGRLYPKDSIVNEHPYQAYDYVILGHTHFKMIRKCGNTTVLNPGSLGQQRDGKGFGYMILDTCQDKVEFRNIDYSKKELYREIERYDSEMGKLKEILERKCVHEKNIGDGN